MLPQSTEIAGKLVEFTAKGNVLIGSIRFRDWLNDIRQCPFCEADLGEPDAFSLRRYSCPCQGWAEFRRLEANLTAKHEVQLRLI
jgi:hypothetical protein